MNSKVKICGITRLDQAQAIVNWGVDYLGFIVVESSPRYRDPSYIYTLINALVLPSVPPAIVGVFANATFAELETIQTLISFQVLQFHGQESPEFCQAIKSRFPQCQIWKAFRIRDSRDLQSLPSYEAIVDAVLLDAYHPQHLGGTGQILDWSNLRNVQPPCPWFLAGGLTPDNVREALQHLSPYGIDVSSGVERSPGDKDLAKVQRLLQAVLVE